MKTYEVECMIADERLVVVEADSPDQAKEKIQAGKYKRLGKSISRGFLLVGAAHEVSR